MSGQERLISCPHEEQKRLSLKISEEQDGQRKCDGFIDAYSLRRLQEQETGLYSYLETVSGTAVLLSIWTRFSRSPQNESNAGQDNNDGGDDCQLETAAAAIG